MACNLSRNNRTHFRGNRDKDFAKIAISVEHIAKDENVC